MALLIVGLNTWYAVATVNKLMASESWLAHTWEVIGQEELIMRTLNSAESSARGYALSSGLEPFLEDYRNAQQNVPSQLDRFGVLTTDSPVQQKGLSDLRVRVASRMELLQDLIDARQKFGLEGASELVNSGAGKVEMNHVRQILDSMDREERRLLTGRSGEVRSNGKHALFAVGLSCFLDLLMIGAVVWYLYRERELRVATESINEQLAVARAKAEHHAEAVRLLNAELEERVRKRTAELESTNRELEAFSYSVSHDLRAPLRTIDGFSLALMEDYSDAVDSVGRDYIARVRSGVQRMGQLIDALLQLSRITRAEIVRETVRPDEIAQRVIEILKEENPERNIQFTLIDGPAAEADPRLLQVALENLLGNAVKFTSRKDHAVISFGWDEEAKAWSVADNGAGFDMYYADKLFNAFNRLHGDKDFKGSGIGLATVARVIRRHGGRIWAHGAVEEGATFWFTLG